MYMIVTKAQTHRQMHTRMLGGQDRLDFRLGCLCSCIATAFTDKMTHKHSRQTEDDEVSLEHMDKDSHTLSLKT
jgi:hypothetical protein